MSENEKILALELILKDIRCNWAWGLEERVDAALDIATDLSKNNKDYKTMCASINEFKEVMKTEEYADGRYFRDVFPEGYEGMDSLHGLTNTYKDKSDEFKECVGCLTYPEYAFTDYE